MHYPLIMISLPTAKVLFFIALTLGPSDPQKIFVTSNSENYVWTHSANGWTFDAQGFPSSDWTREPDRTDIVVANDSEGITGPITSITKHKWDHDSVVILDNGDRIEKDHDTGFYIINAGGPNQKVYTILYNDCATSGKISSK